MTDPENLPLAADFPPATRAQWRKLVDAVLKGAPFERLVGKTYDGLAIEPLAARRPDARPIAGRPGAATWDVLARIDHPDPARANEIALRELNNGAGGLTLVFADSLGSHGFGVPANEQALARTLEGVRFDAGIVVDIDLPPFARELPHIVAKVAGQSAKPATVRLRYGYDPLTAIAISGKLPLAWNKTAPLMAGLIRTLADAGFKGPFAVGDGRAVHNAGGSEAQELAFALAAAVAYLRALEAGGMALDAARDAIYFRLTADAEQFPTIAKFRALRKLWAQVEAFVRAVAEACACRGRDGVANDDAARSAGEHSAHSDRRVRRRTRRRRCDYGVAVHRRVRPARPVCTPHRAQHPASPRRRSAPRQSCRSGRRLRRDGELDR